MTKVLDQHAPPRAKDTATKRAKPNAAHRAKAPANSPVKTTTRKGKIEKLALERGFASGLDMMRRSGKGRTVEELARSFGVHERNLFAYLKARGLKFERRLTITGIVPDDAPRTKPKPRAAASGTR